MSPGLRAPCVLSSQCSLAEFLRTPTCQKQAKAIVVNSLRGDLPRAIPAWQRQMTRRQAHITLFG
ncbi:hypothetical protein THTE_1629 [Thermogutta terrifontis]|uniref:Uncharacterized protein n=1 Tax=Thermogutta terrifontis TaxID=1331910 RepID=A0A286RE41_9BACT|nr:hypothetical protein THTE_1629 [Thermogutta terrifontis]